MQIPDGRHPIACARVSCYAPATRGGIVVVQQNGFTSTHAVYYACDGHPNILAAAVETWPVAVAGESRST